MKLKFLFFFFSLIILNCSSSSKFINTKSEDNIEQVNREIKEKVVLIYLKNTEIPIESDSVFIAQDTLHYHNQYAKTIPLSDINYIKKPPKNNGLSILPGLSLIGYGLYIGNYSSEGESIGEGIGRGIAGLTIVSIGALASAVGIAVNKSRYYYFNENTGFTITSNNDKPCRNPRYKRNC